MKWISLFFILVTFACCKDDEFDLENPDAAQFVALIKNGTYSKKAGNRLPHFTMNHIQQLSPYLNDTTEITSFPTNPISSKYTSPKILNECIMWVIEGIRMDETYPSLEPCLININSNSQTDHFRLTKKQLISISIKYLQWHEEYLSNPNEITRKRDVIDASNFRWN